MQLPCQRYQCRPLESFRFVEAGHSIKQNHKYDASFFNKPCDQWCQCGDYWIRYVRGYNWNVSVKRTSKWHTTCLCRQYTVGCAVFFTVKRECCFSHLWVMSVVFSITHWNTTHEVMNIHGWKVSVLCVFNLDIGLQITVCIYRVYNRCLEPLVSYYQYHVQCHGNIVHYWCVSVCLFHILLWVF